MDKPSGPINTESKAVDGRTGSTDAKVTLAPDADTNFEYRILKLQENWELASLPS